MSLGFAGVLSARGFFSPEIADVFIEKDIKGNKVAMISPSAGRR